MKSRLSLKLISGGCFLAALAIIASRSACAPLASSTVSTAATGPTGAAKSFVHPGLLHTREDFERMKAKVAAGAHPWIDDWRVLIANPHAQLSWRPHPLETVIRGNVPGQNYAALFNDIAAAYQLGLRWKISGDMAYADKSIAILNAWSETLKAVSGNSDRFLAAGIYGYEFANAAEIMRTYSGWAPADFARFQKMMLTVFYPMNHDFLIHHNGAAITNYWANWDLCNMSSIEAIGVLCDRRDLYNEAITYFKTGAGNGALDKAVYYVHPGNLGQWQESGRDQGHNTLGIALMGPICETAWHQGDDLYGYDNNRFLSGAEYVAKYNLGNNVPYEPYAWGTGRGIRQEQMVISAAGRGLLRPGWELVINHYVMRKAIAAPYSEEYAAKMRPEGGGGNYGPNSGGFDQLGFGTLTETRAPEVKNPRPTGLTARKNGDTVLLSWWGAAGATTYRVKRATKAGGRYTTIAPQVRDPLTCVDSNPKPGSDFYVVTGVRDGKETGPSNEVRVSPAARLQMDLKVNGSVGVRAAGAIKRDRPGALFGGAAWAPGKVGSAISLDGKSGYVSLPAGVVSRLSDFTISAWVYLNAAQTGARVFDFGDNRGRYMFLTPKSGDGKIRFAVSTVYGYNEEGIDGEAALPTNRWVHVTVTLSGRVGTLYVSGAAVGANPAIDFPPFRLGYTPENWIGRSRDPNDPYLNGKVDDFRIYDGALKAAKVAALANRR